MRKDNSMNAPPVRQRRDADELEPIRQWSTLPITEEKAKELIDEITRYAAEYVSIPLIELICGLTPSLSYDNSDDLNQRNLVGLAALTYTFTQTRRATNELGAYLVELKCGQWE
jgi:hypothetical protein